MKIQKARMATKVSIRISPESNQSSRWPRDSTSCTQAMVTESDRKPVQSSADRVRWDGRPAGEAQPDEGDQADRHDHVERPAPAVELRQQAAQRRADHRADDHGHAEDRGHLVPAAAWGRRRAGWSATAGSPARPKAPCSTRHRISVSSEFDAPHMKVVGGEQQHRPGHGLGAGRSGRPSQPVIGVVTAVARMLKVIAQAISSWVADMVPCICGSSVEAISRVVA